MPRRSPDPPRPYLRRIHRRGIAVRLGLCAAVAIAFALVPGIDGADRLLLVAFVVGYGIAATVVDLIATPAHNNLASIINAVLGISVLFLVTLFVPDALVLALFPYVIGVVFSAIAWGLLAGLATAGVASAFTWISQALAPASSRMEPVVLVTATVCFFGVALVADRLSAERRSQVQHFGRLYEALRGVSPQPDLSATLESIAGAVTTAVDAKATAIMLSEGGHLVRTGPSSDWGWDEEQIDEYTRRELDAGDD